MIYSKCYFCLWSFLFLYSWILSSLDHNFSIDFNGCILTCEHLSSLQLHFFSNLNISLNSFLNQQHLLLDFIPYYPQNDSFLSILSKIWWKSLSGFFYTSIFCGLLGSLVQWKRCWPVEDNAFDQCRRCWWYGMWKHALFFKLDSFDL